MTGKYLITGVYYIFIGQGTCQYTEHLSQFLNSIIILLLTPAAYYPPFTTTMKVLDSIDIYLMIWPILRKIECIASGKC